MRSQVRLLAIFVLITAAVWSCGPKENPVVDNRDQFVGTWSCHDNTAGNPTYNVVISKSATDDINIFVDNFANLGSGVKAVVKVNSATSFTIASQSISGETVAGSGAFASSKITFNYTENDGVSNITVAATLTKI